MKERGFIGKSSEAILIKAAIDLKADVRREEREAALGHSHSPEQSLDDQVGADGGGATWRSRRLEYWRWKPVSDRIIIFPVFNPVIHLRSGRSPSATHMYRRTTSRLSL
jgi:hypothetical protein